MISFIFKIIFINQYFKLFSCLNHRDIFKNILGLENVIVYSKMIKIKIIFIFLLINLVLDDFFKNNY